MSTNHTATIPAIEVEALLLGMRNLLVESSVDPASDGSVFANGFLIGLMTRAMVQTRDAGTLDLGQLLHDLADATEDVRRMRQRRETLKQLAGETP